MFFMEDIGMYVSLDGYMSSMALVHELISSVCDGFDADPRLGFGGPEACATPLPTSSDLDWTLEKQPMVSDFVFASLSLDAQQNVQGGFGALTSGVPELNYLRILGTAQRSEAMTPRTVRSSGVCQLGVLRQREDGLCGHYAMFNAICVLAACNAPSQAARAEALRRLNDRVRFWQFYALNVRHLLLTVREHAGLAFPWRSVDVTGGQLERTHLVHLARTHPFMDAIGVHRVSVLPGFNAQDLESGTMTAAEISALQETFSEFSLRETYTHAFIVGAHAHWIAVVAHKANMRIEVLFLDSMNTDILGRSDEYVTEVLDQSRAIRDKIEEMQAAGGLETGDLQWIHTLRAMRSVAELVTECVNGKTDLRTHVLDTSIRASLERFFKRVCNADSTSAMARVLASEQSAFMSKLIEYLQAWEPPAAMRTNLVTLSHDIGTKHLSASTRELLLDWTSTLLGSETLCESTIPEVQAFVAVLRDLSAICTHA